MKYLLFFLCVIFVSISGLANERLLTEKGILKLEIDICMTQLSENLENIIYKGQEYPLPNIYGTGLAAAERWFQSSSVGQKWIDAYPEIENIMRSIPLGQTAHQPEHLLAKLHPYTREKYIECNFIPDSE